MGEINDFVQSMQQGSENFVLTNEGSIYKFLGIEIKHLGKQEFEISQPFLIDRILALLQLEHNGFKTDSHDKLTPMAPQILNKDLMGKPQKKSWKYRTAVGMLSYLQGHTWPDISMPVHQTGRFCNNPKLSHDDTAEMEFDGDHVNGVHADVTKNVDEVAAGCKLREVGVFLFGVVVDTDAGIGVVIAAIGRDLFALD